MDRCFHLELVQTASHAQKAQRSAPVSLQWWQYGTLCSECDACITMCLNRACRKVMGYRVWYTLELFRETHFCTCLWGSLRPDIGTCRVSCLVWFHDHILPLSETSTRISRWCCIQHAAVVILSHSSSLGVYCTSKGTWRWCSGWDKKLSMQETICLGLSDKDLRSAPWVFQTILNLELNRTQLCTLLISPSAHSSYMTTCQIQHISIIIDSRWGQSTQMPLCSQEVHIYMYNYLLWWSCAQMGHHGTLSNKERDHTHKKPHKQNLDYYMDKLVYLERQSNNKVCWKWMVLWAREKSDHVILTTMKTTAKVLVEQCSAIYI